VVGVNATDSGRTHPSCSCEGASATTVDPLNAIARRKPATRGTILERLGLEPAFRYGKYRTEFRLAGTAGEAIRDETPIGAYMELEGSPRRIDRMARRLGFTERDYITASYGRLYLDWCAARHIEPGHMVFG
jgi:adenylate cyclase class 2